MPPLKICYLSNSSLPSRHANAVHVMSMAEGLAQAGAEVSLLAYPGDRALLPEASDAAVFDFYGMAPSFEIEWLPGFRARGRSVLSSLSAWRKLGRLRPDFVMGRHGKACALACLRGIPTVYETHKPFSWNSRGDRLLLRRMFAAPAFRGLVTISTPLRDILVEETGLEPSRILVAHDAARAAAPARVERLGAADRLQAGYVGTFYAGRGIELILAAAAELPDMDFHFIGGSAGDLAQWGETAPALANVHFHGFQPPQRAAALRAGCDVLLAPYQRKTLIKDGWDTTRWMSPLKIFEYMSSAKAILCSDLPVLREVMVDEGNALLLPPDDASAWIAALRRLQADPGFARALGARAYQDFAAHHTWERRARRILDFAGVGRARPGP